MPRSNSSAMVVSGASVGQPREDVQPHSSIRSQDTTLTSAGTSAPSSAASQPMSQKRARPIATPLHSAQIVAPPPNEEVAEVAIAGTLQPQPVAESERPTRKKTLREYCWFDGEGPMTTTTRRKLVRSVFWCRSTSRQFLTLAQEERKSKKQLQKRKGRGGQHDSAADTTTTQQRSAANEPRCARTGSMISQSYMICRQQASQPTPQLMVVDGRIVLNQQSMVRHTHS